MRYILRCDPTVSELIYKNLDNSQKAYGPDGVPPIVVKKICSRADTLPGLILLSLSTGF